MTASQTKPVWLNAKATRFAEDCKTFVGGLQKTVTEAIDSELLLSSSQAIAANCIEANKSASGKDFDNKIKVCKQEAKKTLLWLRLVRAPSELVRDASELIEVFSEVLRATKFH